MQETNELQSIQEKENAKMQYKAKLDELKEKFKGIPGQIVALEKFDQIEDAKGASKMLDELQAEGLTPWDVLKTYNSLNKVESKKSKEEIRLDEKIFGLSGSIYRDDSLIKIGNYLIEQRKLEEKAKKFQQNPPKRRSSRLWDIEEEEK